MSLNEEGVRRIYERVGTVLRGKYRLNRVLGVGGMASVFDATHRNGGRVAIKILHAHLAQFPGVRTRFLREGYVANKIAHPGVVRIVDDDEDESENTVFLVMDLLEGETMEARRGRFGGRLPLVEALDDCDRVLDVLSVAHGLGVIHRDLKPDNLFLTSQGELKVLDFGIARLLDGTGATGSGEVLGTPEFMSPEQANGRSREIDERTDLWCVGAVLFTLITGSEVHRAATSAEHLVYAATRPARPIESVAPWLDATLAAVVNRALAFDRQARWPNARAMQEAIRGTPSFAQCVRFRSSAPPRPSATPNSAVARTVDMPEPARPATLPLPAGPTGTIALEPPPGPGGSRPDRR